jgi:hypothetical protein
LVIEPAEFTPNEEITEKVTVTNTSNAQGSYDVVLKIDGTQEAVEAVAATAGDSKIVSFSLEREKYGEYTVIIGSLTGSFELMTQGQLIAAKSYAAMEGIETCRMDMDIEVAMTNPTLGGIEFVASAHKNMDITSNRIYMDMDVIMTMFGEELAMSTEVYIFEERMYMMVESEVLPPEEDGKWYKQKISQTEFSDAWEQQDITTQQFGLLEEAGDVEIMGMEEIRGVECYKIKVNPDVEALEAYLKTQLGYEYSFPPGTDLEDMLGNFAIIFLIAKDTNYITKIVMEYDMPLEGMTATFKINIEIYDVNQPLNNTLTPEAENAEEVFLGTLL